MMQEDSSNATDVGVVQEVSLLRAEMRAAVMQLAELKKYTKEFYQRGIPVVNSPSGDPLQTQAV